MRPEPVWSHLPLISLIFSQPALHFWCAGWEYFFPVGSLQAFPPTIFFPTPNAIFSSPVGRRWWLAMDQRALGRGPHFWAHYPHQKAKKIKVEFCVLRNKSIWNVDTRFSVVHPVWPKVLPHPLPIFLCSSQEQNQCVPSHDHLQSLPQAHLVKSFLSFFINSVFPDLFLIHGFSFNEYIFFQNITSFNVLFTFKNINTKLILWLKDSSFRIQVLLAFRQHSVHPKYLPRHYFRDSKCHPL